MPELTLRGFLLTYSFPSDEKFTYRFKVPRDKVDVVNIVNFLLEYPGVLAKISNEFDREFFGETVVGKEIPLKKRYIKLSNYYGVELTIVSPVIYRSLYRIRDSFTKLIKRELISISTKPTIYLLSEKRYRNIVELKRKVDSELSSLNSIYSEFMKRTVPLLNDLLKKHSVPHEFTYVEKTYITSVSINTAPINVDFSVLKNIDPEIAGEIVSSLRKCIETIVLKIIEKYGKTIKSLQQGRKTVDVEVVRRSLHETKEYLNELGLGILSDTLLNEINKYIDNPHELLIKYRDINEWQQKSLSEISEKILSLLPTRAF